MSAFAAYLLIGVAINLVMAARHDWLHPHDRMGLDDLAVSTAVCAVLWPLAIVLLFRR